jgi:Cys-tRNA(Pro)/Cys-tRNA(Cys) deacylase
MWRSGGNRVAACSADFRESSPGSGVTAFQRLAQTVAESGVAFIIHGHETTRTVADMTRNPLFVTSRIVKTVAFRTRNGRIVLAAVRGTRRVDYVRLAALIGVNRRDLAPLSFGEVQALTGIEPGSVSPLPLTEESVVFIDEDVLTIQPTLFCGIGRADRTLEIASADLVRVSRGRVGSFSKQ